MIPMQLLERVKSNVKLCGLEIAFSGSLTPSAINDWQPFFNSTFSEGEFYKSAASVPRIDFNEESQISSSGTSYKQKVLFRFRNSDINRANRIRLMSSIKFIKLKQTNGLDIVIGRNDYYQNTRPTIKIKADEQVCEVEIETLSIHPTGFIPNPDTYGLPVLIPISLY